MAEELDKLYSFVIRDHANQTRHRGRLANANRRAAGKNSLCGDCVTLQLRIEAGMIQAATFESFGCALCRASASLLTETVRGLRCEAVSELVRAVEALVGEGKASSVGAGAPRSLATVHEFPARIPCAMLPWRTVLDALDPAVFD